MTLLWFYFFVALAVFAATTSSQIVSPTQLQCDFETTCLWRNGSNGVEDSFDWGIADAVVLDSWHSIPRSKDGIGDLFAYTRGTFSGNLGDTALLVGEQINCQIGDGRLQYWFWKTALLPSFAVCVRQPPGSLGSLRCLDSVTGIHAQQWVMRQTIIPASQTPFEIVFKASFQHNFDIIGLDEITYDATLCNDIKRINYCVASVSACGGRFLSYPFALYFVYPSLHTERHHGAILNLKLLFESAETSTKQTGVLSFGAGLPTSNTNETITTSDRAFFPFGDKKKTVVEHRRRRDTSKHQLKPLLSTDLNEQSKQKLPPMLIVARNDDDEDGNGRVITIPLPARVAGKAAKKDQMSGKEKKERQPPEKETEEGSKGEKKMTDEGKDTGMYHDSLQSVAEAAQKAAEVAIAQQDSAAPIGVPNGIPPPTWFQLMRHFVPMLPVMIRQISPPPSAPGGIAGALGYGRRDALPPPLPSFQLDSNGMLVPVVASHQYNGIGGRRNGGFLNKFSPVPAQHQYKSTRFNPALLFTTPSREKSSPSDPFLPPDTNAVDDLDNLAWKRFSFSTPAVPIVGTSFHSSSGPPYGSTVPTSFGVGGVRLMSNGASSVHTVQPPVAAFTTRARLPTVTHAPIPTVTHAPVPAVTHAPIPTGGNRRTTVSPATVTGGATGDCPAVNCVFDGTDLCRYSTGTADLQLPEGASVQGWRLSDQQVSNSLTGIFTDASGTGMYTYAGATDRRADHFVLSSPLFTSSTPTFVHFRYYLAGIEGRLRACVDSVLDCPVERLGKNIKVDARNWKAASFRVPSGAHTVHFIVDGLKKNYVVGLDETILRTTSSSSSNTAFCL